MPSTADWAGLAVPLIALATGVYRRFGNQIRYDKWVDLCQCNSSGCTAGGTEYTVGTGNSGLIHGNAVSGVDWVRIAGFPLASTFSTRLGITYITVSNFSATRYGLYQDDLNPNGHSPVPYFTTTCGMDSTVTVSRGPFTVPPGKGAYLYALPCGGSEYEQFTWTIYAQPCATSGTIPPVITTPTPPTGFPTPPIVGPCTSIGDICGALSVMNQKLDIARMQLQLLQRWGVPFALNYGAVHPGLVGTGELAVSRLIGAHCELTSTDPGRPVLPGNPAYVYDAGWMSINDASGMLEEKRITRYSFDWLPEHMPLATSFKYMLNPGFTLRMTELLVEP